MSTIITRNSATSGSIPSSLTQGELAINVTDGKLFYGSGSGNTVKEFTVSGSGDGTIDTGSFATTGSNIFIGNQIITGSLHQSGTFYPDQIDWFSSSIGYDTGSYILTTTANGLTTYAGYGDVANTLAPYIPTVSSSVSASYAETASYAPAYLPLTGGTINGNVTVNGTASIAFLNVIYESASVIYSSGSNQFGDASNDTQTLWGTVDIKSGPVLVTGSVIANSFTGSLLGTASYATQALSASYAQTASYVQNSQTASYVLSASYALTASYVENAQTASYVTLAQTASYVQTAQTASYVLNAVSASFATLAQTANTASYVENAQTASYVLQAVSASYATTASYSNTSTSASYATTSSYALNALSASYATNGGVTQIIAGPNITVSPTTGVGQVTISSTGGGGGTGNTATGSYGSFYDTTIQTNVASTARSMSLNTTDITNGVSISGSTNPFNTYIKVANAGVYDIQFSAQVDKTDSGTDEIWIWIRKNGTNISDSATSVQLQGNGAHYVAAWNFFVNAAANDYFQLMWYSPDANVRLHAEAGFGVVPGIPSLIVTANRVDQFLSNTGSFSGSFTGEFTGSLLGTSSYATQALSSSYATTASYALNTSTPFRISTGSISASVNIGTDIFRITSGSSTFFNIDNQGSTTISSSASNIFLIKNQNNIPIFSVSQSGVIVIVTQSIELTGSAPNGGIYFTSGALYVGID